MKKNIKTAIFISPALILFFGIKLNNFMIGQTILGKYTSINSGFLKMRPVRKSISRAAVKSYLTFSLNEIKYSISKKDTAKTFKYAERYQSFYFTDSARLKVYRDSLNIDFLTLLTSIKPSYSDILKEYIDRSKITSNFDLLLSAYNKTPDDINFFNLSRNNTIIQYTFLKLKDLCAGSDVETGFYYFNLKGVKGFQYGKPGSSPTTTVRLFVNGKDQYSFMFKKFTQEQIDYVIASIHD